MKALVLEQNATLVFKDVPEPEPVGERPVGVRVTASGICGSDLHRGFENGAYHYPLVMGHEFAAVVEDVPAGSSYCAGDRVAVFPLLNCGQCAACQTGEYAQCSNYDYFGSRRNGGFAERLLVPEANLVRIPDYVSNRQAAMTEPCAVALHGVGQLDIKPGMTALVIGGGPIGNMAAQWLRIRGCSPVIVADIDQTKLRMAADMDLEVVASGNGLLPEAIAERTGGRGVDCVIEACGLPVTALQSIKCAGRFGQVVFLGNIKGDFSVPEKDFSSILRKELRIRGTWNSRFTPRGTDEWTTALHFMNRGINLDPLISHTPPLADGADVFRRIVSRSEYFSKVIFEI